MFADRRDAGERLAGRLARLAPERPIVVGMARGGVPVAAVVAERLGAPLDVIVVRKIGVPWQPELAAGALSEDGVEVLNEGLMAGLELTRRELEPVIGHERRVLAERLARYRGDRPAISVDGRLVILVDDGLATGATARSAIATLRGRGARRVVLAAPVAPPSTMADLRGDADEVVAVETPDEMVAIGLWYRSFPQTPDDEVARLIEAARAGDDRGGG
jgi:putative phosphoribosyl transferase